MESLPWLRARLIAGYGAEQEEAEEVRQSAEEGRRQGEGEESALEEDPEARGLQALFVCSDAWASYRQIFQASHAVVHTYAIISVVHTIHQ